MDKSPLQRVPRSSRSRGNSGRVWSNTARTPPPTSPPDKKGCLESLLPLLLIVLLPFLLTQAAGAKSQGMSWISLPYGDAVTCGVDDGQAYAQMHFYEWSGLRPDWIYILVAGPTTVDYATGAVNPHYRITDVYPSDWEWETGYEDYREQYISGPVTDAMWSDTLNRTDVDIGYSIELHPLGAGEYTVEHWMAGAYSTSLQIANAGTAVYTSNCNWIHLPWILKSSKAE